MAAPMKTCFPILRNHTFLRNTCRYYARKTKNRTPDFISPEEDVLKLKSKIRDPRNNAYLPFIPEDPVQRSMSKAAKKKNENTFTNKYNEIKPDNVRDQKSRVNKKPVLSSRRSNADIDKVGRRQQDTIDFEKLEEADKRFGRLIVVARSKTSREENREIVLEGKQLIKDALECGAKLKVLYFTKFENVEELPTQLFGDAKLYKVLFRHLKLWSEVENPQGLLGIFKLPDKVLRPISDPIPLTLICDSVRNGGNLGTLIRSAAAVGCQQVIALKGCVDIWNGKVLRSAAGSNFHIPILSNVTWSELPAILPPADNICVYLADIKQVIKENDPTESATSETIAAMKQIEQVEDYESDVDDEALNIETDTGSIDDDDYESDDNDDGGSRKNKTLPNEIEEDLSYKSFNVLNAYRNAPLSSSVYDKVDYSNKHTVLVIGGEDSSLSLPARKLTFDHFGQCVRLPTTGEVNSLNCAIAGSIIMFEVAKQHRNNNVTKSDEDE